MERLISGIKPSGALTLGNYIGAIREFVKYQNEYETFVFIADLHALTLKINPDDLRENTKNLIATYIASGLNPDKVTLFKQSDICEHNQLEWILTCNTNLSDLTKMPQYKNYVDKHKNEQTPSGMLLYPSLMNADILLYQAKYVPVGEDQKPHVDLTRDIAEIFNKRYGQTFVVPEPILAKSGAKIMSLSDPTKKMSKSESDKGTIYLFDSIDTIANKIKKATTDSENKVYFDKANKPGISNLLTITSSLSGKSIAELEKQYENISNYGIFKNDIIEIVVDELSKLQIKINEIKEDNSLDFTLKVGANRARECAKMTLDAVYEKVGLR